MKKTGSDRHFQLGESRTGCASAAHPLAPLEVLESTYSYKALCLHRLFQLHNQHPQPRPSLTSLLIAQLGQMRSQRGQFPSHRRHYFCLLDRSLFWGFVTAKSRGKLSCLSEGEASRCETGILAESEFLATFRQAESVASPERILRSYFTLSARFSGRPCWSSG